jgi:hypothetical protein
MNWIIVDMWLAGSTVVGIALLVLAHLTETVPDVQHRTREAPVMMQQEIALASPSLKS